MPPWGMSNEFITSCVCVSPVCACRCVWELSSPSWSCKWHCRRARRDESSRDEARRNFHLFLCMFRHVVNSSPTSIWKATPSTPPPPLSPSFYLLRSGPLGKSMLVTYYSIHQVGSASLSVRFCCYLYLLHACVCVCGSVCVGVWMCIYPFTYP